MTLKRMSNRSIRPAVIAIMQNMHPEDRTLKKIGNAIKKDGYIIPSNSTLQRAIDAFHDNGFTSDQIQQGLNGDTEPKIAVSDLALLLEHKGLIKRIGIDNIKAIAIADKW